MKLLSDCVKELKTSTGVIIELCRKNEIEILKKDYVKSYVADFNKLEEALIRKRNKEEKRIETNSPKINRVENSKKSKMTKAVIKERIRIASKFKQENGGASILLLKELE